jgi:uncharacterized membrane protein
VSETDQDSEPTGPPSRRGLAWLLVIGGLIGFLASFDLTVEKIKLLADPNYRPTCSINPVLSCGSVMIKPQASIFGFPNSLIGITGFAVVITIGMAVFAGAILRDWYWWGLQVGTSLAIVMLTWLQFQSLYTIGALCPYCMVVWVVTIPIFVYVTTSNMTAGVIPVSRGVAREFARYSWAIVAIWLAILVAMIIMRFPDVLSA